MVDIPTLATILVCILLSMTLHEAMHGYVSYWLGDDTAKLQGRLTLNPLAHIDPAMTVLLPLLLVAFGFPPFGAAKPVPFNPNRLKFGEWGTALVGLAGPLTNLLLAVIGAICWRLFAGGADVLVSNFLELFVLVNASFFLFNIIPFPPLDGSRALYAIAPDVVREGMERIESMGAMAILLFFFIFSVFLAQPFTVVLSRFVTLLLGS